MNNDKRLDFVRKRFFFYLGFLLLITLTLIMLRPFFTTIIISLISVILLKPLYDYFLGLSFVKERQRTAVALTLLSALVVVVVPLYLVVSLTVTQITAAVSDLGTQDTEAFTQSVQELLDGITTSADPAEETAEVIDSIQNFVISAGLGVAQWAADQAKNIPILITHFIIFIAIVASLLPFFDDLIALSLKVSPIGRDLAQLYNRKIVAMVKSLITGVFLIALIQGLAMGVFYWLAGYSYVFLLTMISILLAIIPMVGISWMVIGLAIMSLILGDPTQAIIILFGFYGVVNWIDVLLRPKFISKEAHLNTVLFLLAMFGGLTWAGIMGLFYGPIIMLLLVTTVEIYIEKFAKEDGEVLTTAVSSRTERNNEAQSDALSANNAEENTTSKLSPNSS